MSKIGISKTEKIKLKLIDLALVSTSHGLPSIFRSDKISIKLMWLIMLLASTGAGLYTIINSVFDYISYEIVTSIDLINETPIKFPAVTFYNLRNTKDNISLEKVLFICIFNKNVCNSSDFEKIVDKFQQISYRFKPNEVNLAGKIYGLQLVFYNQITPDPQSYSNGFGIIVHNHSIDPGYYGGISNNEITVSPGFTSNLAIMRKFSYKLGNPYNHCLKDINSLDSSKSDIYRYILFSTNYSYTQKDCIDYCLGRELYKYYNISNQIENYINAIAILQEKYNITDAYKVANNIIRYSINDICSSSVCPLECDSVSYDISVSFSKLMISEKYFNFYKQNTKINYTKSYEDIDLNDFVALNIYYSYQHYTITTQAEKATQLDLISNIGGLLGLFIGISFLSFAELLEAFIEVIFIIFERKKIQTIDVLN